MEIICQVAPAGSIIIPFKLFIKNFSTVDLLGKNIPSNFKEMKINGCLPLEGKSFSVLENISIMKDFTKEN